MLQPLRSSILSSSAPLLRPLASTSISKSICSTIRLSARTMCNDASASIPTPPVAKKVKHEMELFGDVRVDNYYWLRDDHRSDPEVLSYLKEENDYTDRVMSGTKQLEDEIYAEIRARIKEDDISAPIRRGPYYYYRRTLQGKEYVQHCRRLAPNHEASLSVHDTMPTGPDAPPEHVILDENVKAQGEEFYSISAFKVSPNGKLVAYAEDTIGNEIYTVHIIDIESRAPVGEPLVRMTSELEWAGDEALVYVTMDEILRLDKVQVLALDQYAMKTRVAQVMKALVYVTMDEILRLDKVQVWLHRLGTDQAHDTCLYHEKDDIFSLDLRASESKKYLFVASESKTTRFVFYLDISKIDDGLLALTQRVNGIETYASHRGNHFFIQRKSDECFNSELIACPVENISATSALLPHRPSIKIQEMQLFSDHLAVYERENGLPKITVYRLPAAGESLEELQGGRVVDFVDPIYSVDPSESQFSSSILRFFYSSLKTPPSVYDYDMDTGVSVLKKIDPVLGGFDSSNYVTERQQATASDGTEIPISITYKKNLVKLDGSDPLLLYGYGSYEVLHY
nr:prolyl endopeptidase-like [Ipomoea batatas]